MLVHSVGDNNSVPILHLYTFRPSVIVGRYQNLEAAVDLKRCHELSIEYNRRYTGGGTVLMDSEQLALGFAISLNSSHLPRSVRGIFHTFGGIIVEALDKLGIQAEFRPKNDIEVKGKKIAGLSAVVDKKDVLLFHTSLLLDFDFSLMLETLNLPTEKIADKGISCFTERLTTIRAELSKRIEMSTVIKVIRGSFEHHFNVSFQKGHFDPWEKHKLDELIQNRYSSEEWLFCVKKSKNRMAHAYRKTPGGLLQVYIALVNGVIESAVITGDFFSTTADINRIESALKWSAADRASVEKTLDEVMSKESIHGVTVDDLTETIMKAIQTI